MVYKNQVHVSTKYVKTQNTKKKKKKPKTKTEKAEKKKRALLTARTA